MTINKKIFLLFTTLFVILLSLIYFILKDKESNAIIFENQIVKNKVSNLQYILENKNNLLNNIAYEYSKNEDIIKFLNSKLRENSFFDISSKQDISYFLILDNEKNILYSESFDTSSKEYMDLSYLDNDFFSKIDLLEFVNNKNKLKFTTLDYEKLIFSVEKIDDLGYIFIAKTIDSSFLTMLSSTLDAYISLLPSYKMLEQIKYFDFIYDIQRDDNEKLLYSTIKLQDDLTKDEFYLSLKITRHFYNEMLESNKSLLQLFFVSFLVFNIIIYIFINKIFTHRIELISKTVKNISKKRHLVENIELIYDDEITYLSSKMNEMFKIIHNTQNENIKKERDFLQSVLDSQQHIIFITDGSNIHSANKKFLDVFKDSGSFLNNIAILDEQSKTNLLNIAKKHSSIDKPAKFKLTEDEHKYFVFDISRVELSKYIICMNDVSKYNEKIQLLEAKASIDELTSCFNKNTIRDYCSYWLEIKDFGLMIIDIDKFKNINDTYGHYIGDCILRDLSSLIKNHLHQDDLIGRFGGEEFIIAVNTSIDNLENIANRIRQIVQENIFSYEDLDLNITISLGCTYCNEGDNFDDLFKIADEALYLAKNSGRNRVVFKNHEKKAS